MDLKATRPQPVDHAILIQNLRNDERFVIDEDGLPETEERLEDYLVGRLVDYDDICYDEQADLLYKLAGQVTHHLRSYLADEESVLNVLLYNLRMWVELIHAQMQKKRWTKSAGFDVSASRGFESLKDVPFTAIEKQAARDLREPPEPLHDIPKMLFTGFARCLYPIQKFGSDPERRFAILLEDEKRELKWFKPARDQFRIYYRGDQTYEPDFVVETEADKLLCEPKRTNDIQDEDVQAKAKAATEWCRHATDHEVANGGKPWSYVLIPHDAIMASASLAGLVAKYTLS